MSFDQLPDSIYATFPWRAIKLCRSKAEFLGSDGTNDAAKMMEMTSGMAWTRAMHYAFTNRHVCVLFAVKLYVLHLCTNKV